jgi:hypothetical protein
MKGNYKSEFEGIENYGRKETDDVDSIFKIENIIIGNK